MVEASNARFKMNGIELERERNNNIDDVLSGVNLTLKQKSEGPFTLNVKSESGTAKEDILAFVEAYNNYLETALGAGKVSQGLLVNDARKRKLESGILSGDSTLRRLTTNLKGLMIRAYPAKTKPHYKVLASIGLHTGDIGASWSDIRRGLLQVDDKKLEAALSQHPLSVKELFSLDTNGDKRIDNGVAYQVILTLKPYTRYKGLIDSKTGLIRDQNTDINKQITKHEEYLIKYEDKMRSKFRAMETALRKSKSMSDYLKNNNPNKK